MGKRILAFIVIGFMMVIQTIALYADVKADYYDETEFVKNYNNLFVDAVNNNEFYLIQDMLDKDKSVYLKEKSAISGYVSKGITLNLIEYFTYHNEEISKTEVNVFQSIKMEIVQKNKIKSTRYIVKVFTVLNNGKDLKIVNIRTLNETTANISSFIKGLQKIKSQSFPVNLNNWGSVCFNSYQQSVDRRKKLSFYLCDDTEDALYQFPPFYGNKWANFDKIDAIAFKDVNGDQLKDVVIIAEYDTGNSAKPFLVASIYFQKDNKFRNIPSLDDKINHTGHNKTINTVLNFVKGKA